MRVSFDKSISSLAVEITEAERNYLGGRRIKVLLDEIGHGRVRLVPSENTQGYLLSENVKKHEKVYRSQIALHDEKARIMDRLAPPIFQPMYVHHRRGTCAQPKHAYR